MKSEQALMIATSAALATLLPVAAHQLGRIEHLPDPPGDLFASDQITQSKASHPLGIPDSLLGIGSYGATLLLIFMARKSPASRNILAAKLLADGSLASVNMVRQVVSFRKLCSWCTATALCTAGMLFAGKDLIARLFSDSR